MAGLSVKCFVVLVIRGTSIKLIFTFMVLFKSSSYFRRLLFNLSELFKKIIGSNISDNVQFRMDKLFFLVCRLQFEIKLNVLCPNCFLKSLV